MRRAKFGKVRSFFIPSAIFYLICLELPIKSLLKFKCVSKEWNSLMEEHEFIDSHRLRSRIRPGGLRFRKLRVGPGKYGSPVLLIMNSDGNPESTGIELDQCRWSLHVETVSPFLFSIKFWWRQFRQSVRGLVCFGDIILNPGTKEAIKLPDHEDFGGYIPERFRTLQYDVICYCIGFDAHSKSYKALIVFSNLKEDRTILKGGKEDFEPLLLARVLTLGTDSSWRNVDVSIPYEWALPDRPFSYIRVHTSVFVGNKIFFLISPFFQQEEIIRRPRLLAFGVQDEKFRLRSLPGDLTLSIHIFEFHGRLGILSAVERGIVWVLEDYELEKWIKKKISSKKHNNTSFTEIKSDDFLISKDVDSIFPLKHITTTDQHIWRWGQDQN